FDPRQEQEQDKSDGHAYLDDLLAPLPFGTRPCRESALDKFRIGSQEVPGDQDNGYREECPVDPRLPEPKRPCGKKEHDPQGDDEECGACPGFPGEKVLFHSSSCPYYGLPDAEIRL